MGNPEPRDSRPKQHSSEDQANHAEDNPDVRPRKFNGASISWSGSCGFHGCIRAREQGRTGLVGDFRLDEKAVTLARNGLDIERLIGRVAESLAQFIDGGVDVGVVIDVRVCRP